MDSDGFGMPDALEQARWMGPKLVIDVGQFFLHQKRSFLALLS